MLNNFENIHPLLSKVARILIIGLIFTAGFLGTIAIMVIEKSPVVTSLTNRLSWLFAANSVQSMWYITRSAGIISYILLWFSTVWGLALPSKLFDRILPRAFSYDFHQFISLLAIGFIILHVGVLLIDRYLPFTLVQILVPFYSTYRPFWVGLGVIGFYLILLVTVTFYLRSQIGMKAFRAIHLLSLVTYLGAVIHGFFSGTDSSLLAAQLLYFSTSLVVLFMTLYWIMMAVRQKTEAPTTTSLHPSKTTKNQRRLAR